MTDIFIAIIEDRHCDTEVRPFTTPDAAVEWVSGYVARQVPIDEFFDYNHDDEMRRVGWIYFMRYSSEGDSVRVIRRVLDSTSKSWTDPE